MPVAVYYDPRFLEHRTGSHPEHPGRLVACVERLQEAGLWERTVRPACEPAAWEALTACHDAGYLHLLEQACARGGGYLTPDTPFSERSFEAARLAAGAAVAAADAVLAGQFAHAFVLSRPPGHHATRDQGMGFCLINHVAVAARHLVRTRRLERVLVVDIDVHHGNGTQEIFFDDPAVLYVSTHQYPAYPGTGAVDEIGRGAGTGYTVNVPLPAGVGDTGFLRAYREVVLPVARRYRPQFVFVSAGYDAHWSNYRYLASIQMQVSVAGYLAVIRELRDLALATCGGRLVCVLEGGYDPEALAWSVEGTLRVLAGEDGRDPLGPSPHPWPQPEIGPILAAVRARHSLAE